MTTALLRPLAAADLVALTRYYRGEGGDGPAERFFDAAAAALDAITRMPSAGSPRAGELCGIPGLRVRRLVGFLCGWFYFTAHDHVDVVRLLADARRRTTAELACIEYAIRRIRAPGTAGQLPEGCCVCRGDGGFSRHSGVGVQLS